MEDIVHSGMHSCANIDAACLDLFCEMHQCVDCPQAVSLIFVEVLSADEFFVMLDCEEQQCVDIYVLVLWSVVYGYLTGQLRVAASCCYIVCLDDCPVCTGLGLI